MLSGIQRTSSVINTGLQKKLFIKCYFVCFCFLEIISSDTVLANIHILIRLDCYHSLSKKCVRKQEVGKINVIYYNYCTFGGKQTNKIYL